MPDDDIKKLGGAYQRALDTWAKDVGTLTVDLEGLKQQIDALKGKSEDSTKLKKLEVDWDAIMKKLDGQCDQLCRKIKDLPSLKEPDDKALKDLQKQLPGWMRKTIERVQKGGVPIPYPDVTLDDGKIKVKGVKVWGKF